jgi:hypothetical protein
MDLTTIAALASAVISALTFIGYRRDKRFDKIDYRFDNLEKRIEIDYQFRKTDFEIFEKKMDSSFQSLEKRMQNGLDKIEVKFENLHRKMHATLIEIDDRFDRGANIIYERFDVLQDGIDERFSEIRSRIDKIGEDIWEIRERLVFIEALIFFNEGSITPPTRSDAAKKMWQKRRGKQIEERE